MEINSSPQETFPLVIAYAGTLYHIQSVNVLVRKIQSGPYVMVGS